MSSARAGTVELVKAGILTTMLRWSAPGDNHWPDMLGMHGASTPTCRQRADLLLVSGPPDDRVTGRSQAASTARLSTSSTLGINKIPGPIWLLS